MRCVGRRGMGVWAEGTQSIVAPGGQEDRCAEQLHGRQWIGAQGRKQGDESLS